MRKKGCVNWKRNTDNKHEGFTLIELLAVIVIISVIFGLISYFVIKTINNSKEKSLVITKTNILKTASTYAWEDENLVWIQNGDNTDEIFTCLNIQELINEGYYDKDILKNEEIKKDKIRNIIVVKDNNSKVITNTVLDKPDSNTNKGKCDTSFKYVKIPECNDELVYNSYDQQLINTSNIDVNNYVFMDEDKNEIEDITNYKQKNAGTYTIKTIPKDNYVWKNKYTNGEMDVECKINKLKTYIALSPNGSTSSGKLQVTTIKPMIDRNQNLDENLINSIMTTEKISGKIKINNPNTNLITYSLDNSNSKITSDNENKESTFETKLEEESNLQINRSSNNFKKYDIKISFMPDNNNYDSSTAIYHLRKNLTYKVTLDANKGKIQGNDTKICYLSSNDTYKDCLEVPVRVGYVFKGWKYNNETITNNTIFKENQPIKVIASWEPIKYTISFNGYGSSITCTYNKYCTLTKANLKNGYTFLGWATSSSGGVVYFDEQSVINLTTKNEEVINLYAKWKANTYTIVFDGNGNNGGSTASKNCTYDANCTLTSNGFSKTGYTFSGWATSSSGGVIYSNGQSVKNLTSTDGGTVTLYAKWKANTYTIVFIGNGNNGGSTKNKTCTYDTDCTLTSNGFTKTGYHFSKWSFGNSTYNNKATVKNLTTTNNGTVNLTANWKANTYTIVFDGNKNTSGKTASKNCTYDTNCTLTSNGFSRTGYSFSKWSFGNSTYNNKATVKNLTTTNNGTVTLKANWVDKIKPTCETTKSNTDSKSGVTVTVKCSDSGSGCKNASSKHTGVKKDTTYTVKDNSGNSGSCSVSVSSKTKWRKKTCSTCKRCSDAGCDSYSYTPWSKSNSSSNVVGVDPKNCTTYNKTYSDFKKRVCNNGSAVVINGRHECPCYIYTRSKYCNTYKRSCSSCGCSSWGSWGSYSTTKCSKDSSTKCESAKFYS